MTTLRVIRPDTAEDDGEDGCAACADTPVALVFHVGGQPLGPVPPLERCELCGRALVEFGRLLEVPSRGG